MSAALLLASTSTAAPAPTAKTPATTSANPAEPDPALRSNGTAAPLVTADGSALTSPASHIYLVDYDTGAVLANKAGDMKMYPSSMTKMMTLYIVFERLK
ncbi:MAG: hypothetical protein B7X02_02610, partial [Rhodospirillales bacterium 12-54-5]